MVFSQNIKDLDMFVYKLKMFAVISIAITHNELESLQFANNCTCSMCQSGSALFWPDVTKKGIFLFKNSPFFFLYVKWSVGWNIKRSFRSIDKKVVAKIFFCELHSIDILENLICFSSSLFSIKSDIITKLIKNFICTFSQKEK